MRVAIDGMLVGRRFSGVEESIANLARALAVSGTHDYTLYTRAARLFGTPPSDRWRLGSSRWPVGNRAVRILWEQAVLPVRLRRERIDVLHAPGYVAPVLAPVPVVLTVYDLIAIRHPGLCTRSNAWHYRALLRLSAGKAAAIIVPSAATRDDLARYLPSVAGRIRVIPLGIAARFRSEPDAAARAAVGAKYGIRGPCILFVGRTEPKKNLVRLVESYALLRQSGDISHPLVLAGIPSWDQARVERAVRARGLGGQVIFTGFVPHEELPALYRLADAFVFPSLCEGFGLPPLEAMACGVPVVVSDRGSLPEVTGGAALAVDPLDPGAMAEALRTVLRRPEVRRDLAARGLARAREFTWERAAAATEAVYTEAFEGRRRG